MISEHIPSYEGLKYLCVDNNLSRKSPKSSNSNNHEITLNRLLKHCCSLLNERDDIIIVHDPNIPCINERMIDDLCQEALSTALPAYQRLII